MSDQATSGSNTAPPALLAKNPAAWLALFGPGAVIASLTIGTGELIFSTRGGALFGYRVLFLFLFVSLLKWGLVLATARHMVLSGAHPYRRMMDLPGPRGWLVILFFLLAIPSFPIWVGFHSGVVGNLMSWITGTKDAFHGGGDYFWGMAVLGGVLALVATGGYSIFERIQVAIVFLMVLCAGVTLVIYNPPWLEMLIGAFVPRPYEYPDWLPESYPDIAKYNVWVETTRYVGVIGGASYDYLAYTSFLREKQWGNSSAGVVERRELDQIAEDPAHPVRSWVTAPLVDLTASFLLIVAFSAVFVASGALVLGPQHKIPDGDNFLNLQAEFVTALHPWLLPLYLVAALLTMLGTLYGTIEVACSISNEVGRSLVPSFTQRYERRIRLSTVAWCALGAISLLAYNFYHKSIGSESGGGRILLDKFLTPVNLFTGVLGCGILCLLVSRFDRQALPQSLRMPGWLAGLNWFAAAIFIALGIKGYYDHESRYQAISALTIALVVSLVIARFRKPASSP